MDEKYARYFEVTDRFTREVQDADKPEQVAILLSRNLSEALGETVQYAFVDRIRERICQSTRVDRAVKQILPYFLDKKFANEVAKIDWNVIDTRGATLLFEKFVKKEINFEASFLVFPKKRQNYVTHYSILWGGRKIEKLGKEDIDFIASCCNVAEIRIIWAYQIGENTSEDKLLKRTTFELRELSGIGADLTTLGKEDFFGSLLLNVMGRALSKSAVLILSTNENNTEYKVIATRGIDKKSISAIQLSSKTMIVKEIQKLKGPLLVTDIIDRLSEHEREIIARLEATIFVPLVSKEAVIGILALGERINMQPYNGNVIDSISLLSNQMVMAIENSRLSDIRYAFSRYVSHQLADGILSDPDQIKLGGERRAVTVLFADIRGFTTMSEHMKPEDVVDLLNTYLSGLSEVVFRYEGTVDKYIGDCVMGVFGAPVSHDNDAERAVFSAVEMQEFVHDINEKRVADGLEKVEIGVGVNTGEVIAGNMGSVDRMDYTVIGDVVNIASRLEGIAGKGQILVTKDVYDNVKYLVEGGYVDTLNVKGRENPVEVFEVRDVIARKYLKTLEEREPYIIGHFLNIAEDIALIAKEMGFNREEIVKLKAAAMLMDVGRIGLNERIFNKRGKLTPEEYEIVKSHVLRGAEYAEKRLNLFKEGVELIKYHHENFDGTGYPNGLKGEKIPIWARIVSVVDGYHALIERRPHREPLNEEKALELIIENSGKRYDPKIVDIYVSILKKRLIRG